MQVPVSELENRIARFRNQMNIINPGWEIAVIFSKINLYYFTGTMQEGMLLINRDGEDIFWVRRSYERAKEESLFKVIKFMSSFEDAAKNYRKLPDTIFLESEFVPLAMFQRFQKHFPFKIFKPLDTPLAKIRSIKSSYSSR